MAVLRNTPYSPAFFIVDFGKGNTQAEVLEVIIPEARVQVAEYRSGNESENNIRKLPTLTKYGNLILKRGAIGALDWYSWWDQVRNGNPAPQTVTVQLWNEDHTATVLSWRFFRAFPVNHQFEPLNALQSTQVLIESLELAFERMEMQ